MRNVGDVNAQPPMPLVGPHQADRVVEIARVDRIDRNHHFAGQIGPLGRNRLVELFGFDPRFFQRVGRKRLGQIEFANDRQRVDARRAARAEDFGDHAFAVLIVGRKADHFQHDFVVGPGRLRAGIAHQDRPREWFAVDLHIGHAGRFEVGADKLPRAALDDLDDLAFGIRPRAGAARLQPQQHRVAARSIA